MNRSAHRRLLQSGCFAALQGALTVSPLAEVRFAKLTLSWRFSDEPEILYPFCPFCQEGCRSFLTCFFPFTMTHSPVRAHSPQPQQETAPLLWLFTRYQRQPAPPNTCPSMIQVVHVIPDLPLCFFRSYHGKGLSVSGIRNKTAFQSISDSKMHGPRGATQRNAGSGQAVTETPNAADRLE